MLRVFGCAIAGLVLLGGLVMAADHRGYLKAVDKNQITVTVTVPDATDKDKEKDKDIVIKTGANTKYFGGKDQISLADLNKMLKESEDMRLRVLVKTSGSDAGEVASEVRVAARKK